MNRGSKPAGPSPDFGEIYDAWFQSVCRWAMALGATSADREDVTQEVFLTVRKKLSGFDGDNVAGWLYRITELTVRNHRRRGWFRHLVFGDRAGAAADNREAPNGPAVLLEKKEEQRLLAGLLQRMKEPRRTTFILFEIEGYSGEEISRIQNLPVATVWTRLHHARKQFLALVEELQAHDKGRADR